MTERMPLVTARSKALALVRLLEDACERIEVAGSVRRCVPMVKDVEIVAVPRIDQEPEGLWGEPVLVDRLEQRVAKLFGDGVLLPRTVELHRADGTVELSQRNGDSYKALVYEGAPIDLFVVRAPAEWGVIFALRTGPGDWNTRLVIECKRFFRRVDGGRVWHAGKPIPCLEEIDFFNAIGQIWVEPELRHVDRVQLRSPA